MTRDRDPHGSARRTYEWPRPAVTVDVVLFTVQGGVAQQELEVLLVERAQPPFQGTWALPGGFVHENEDLAPAAARELLEETGVRDVYLEQVATVGTPGRDPRGHTVTVVFVALVPAGAHPLTPAGDAREARWFRVGELPPVAFDHGRLIAAALEKLRASLGQSPACFALLPPRFSLTELQALCEAILGRALDRRNFRRKVLELGFVVPVQGARSGGAHRPAQLHRFVPAAFARYASQRKALPFY